MQKALLAALLVIGVPALKISRLVEMVALLETVVMEAEQLSDHTLHPIVWYLILRRPAPLDVWSASRFCSNWKTKFYFPGTVAPPAVRDWYS